MHAIGCRYAFRLWCFPLLSYVPSSRIPRGSFSPDDWRLSFWKQDRFGLAAALANRSVFARQVGILILVIFCCAMLHEYWYKRDKKRVLRQLAATVATAVGVGALYLFLLCAFGTPFIVAQVEASRWNQTFPL